MINAILANTLLPRIIEEFLICMVEGNSIERVYEAVLDGEVGDGIE